MINSTQFINGLWMGVVLILLGMVPGALQKCANALSAFAGMMQYRFPVPGRCELQIAQPRWLAVAGIAIIAVALTLFFMP